MGSKMKIYKDIIFNNNFKFFIYTLVLIAFGTTIIILSNIMNLFNSDKGIVVNDEIISFGVILMVIAGFMFFIALINISVFAVKRQKRSFYLFEDRVSTKYGKEIETDIFFKDIYEVYRFRTLTNKIKVPFGIMDCLAYRKDKEEPWIVVLPTLRCGFRKNKGLEMIEGIVGGYVNERLVRDFYSLKGGKVLTFEYLISDNKNRRDIFDSALYKLAYKPLKEHLRLENSKIYCKANIHKIILEMNALIYNDQKIYLDATDSINKRKVDVDTIDFADITDFQTGNIIDIVDKDGNSKLSVNTTCLVNGDLFVALLEKVFEGLKQHTDEVEPQKLESENLEQAVEPISELSSFEEQDDRI